MAVQNSTVMGSYFSSPEESKFDKLYYPFDRLVTALDIIDFELDVFNRPECLAKLNYNFQYVALHLYVLLCEVEGCQSKIDAVLKQKLPHFEMLLRLIGIAKEVGLKTQELIDVCCTNIMITKCLFTGFRLQPGKIYIMEFGVMSSHPEICNWRHDKYPIGSLYSNLNISFKTLTGIEDPAKLLEISDTILNLKGKKRYYDLATFKYRNGTDLAVQYNDEFRIMCSEEVQHYYFFLGMLMSPESFDDFRKMLKDISSTSVPIVESSAQPIANTSSKEKEPMGSKVEIKYSKSVVVPPKVNVLTQKFETMNISDVKSEPKISKRQSIPKAVRDKVWRRHSDKFEGTCWVCGTNIKYESWHCAHIIPDSQGGLPTLENLVPSCTSCNLSMHDMNMFQYLSKYHPERIQELGWKQGYYPIHVPILDNEIL